MKSGLVPEPEGAPATFTSRLARDDRVFDCQTLLGPIWERPVIGPRRKIRGMPRAGPASELTSRCEVDATREYGILRNCSFGRINQPSIRLSKSNDNDDGWGHVVEIRARWKCVLVRDRERGGRKMGRVSKRLDT